ncbi:MAG TPA: hypothetical protein VHE35_36290, partial [Kofleriaceae bacterium]|nr:hypothetical protein [Kofleriaceae bacterium]
MADREDIDALLIGALYGELDESDRARLDAHLASHPQDRHSLEAMRSTRGLLRDAEVATAMVEPPAAISALLLQEAARRAPAPRTAGSRGGLLGFLATLLQPVMANPALSAAAALVVVAGTAGVLYLHGNAHVVQPDRAGSMRSELPASEGSGSAAVATAASVGAGSAAATPTPTMPSTDRALALRPLGAQTSTPAQGQLEPRGREQEAALAARHDDATRTAELQARAPGYDSYRVSLDESKDKAADGQNDQAQLGIGTGRGEPRTAPAATQKELAKGNGAEHGSYVEVGRGDEPAVRNLRDDVVADEPENGLAGKPGGGAPAAATAVATAVAPGGFAQVPGAPTALPPPPPAAAGDRERKLEAAGSGAGSGTLAVDANGRVVAPGAATSFARGNQSGQYATGSGSGTTTLVDPTVVAPYNARSDAATLAWARDQHARMVKLADAGKCNEMGTLGAQVAR